MQIINLTPHAVDIVTPDGIKSFPKADIPARAAERLTPVLERDGIAICSVERGEIVGLPEPQPGVIYIVSTMLREMVPTRFDLVSPADFVRDDQGRIVGARTLAGGKWIGCWLQ